MLYPKCKGGDKSLVEAREMPEVGAILGYPGHLGRKRKGVAPCLLLSLYLNYALVRLHICFT
jgi:hypothetical protein